MLRVRVTIYFLFLSFSGILGQDCDFFLVDIDTISFRVVARSGEITVEWNQDDQSSFTGWLMGDSIRRNSLLLDVIKKIEFQEADLVVELEILNPDEDIRYEIGIDLFQHSEKMRSTLNTNSGQVFRQIVFHDVLEDALEIGEEYQLVLRNRACSDICNDPPEFTLAQQLPYYGGWVIAGAVVGLGQIFYRNYERDLQDYERAWKEGLSDPGTGINIRGSYNTFKWLTYGGIGILAADGIAYFIRKKRIKRRRKRYDYFCPMQPNVRKKPELSVGSMGIGLRWNF